MGFRLLSPEAHPTQVVLKYQDWQMLILRAVMALIGSVISVVGGISVQQEFQLSNVLILGFGVSLIGLACVLNWFVNVPDKLVFDNERGWLCIEEKKGRATQRAYLPYTDILTFRMERYVGTSGDSSTPWFIVFLVKQDGAFWELYTSRSEETSREVFVYLQEHVDLSKEPDFVDASPPQDVFEVLEEPHRTLVTWKAPAALSKYLFAFFILLALSSVVSGIVLYGGMPLFLGGGLAAFLGMLWLLIGYSFFANLSAKMMVEVRKKELEVRQEGGITHKQPFTLPLFKLKALCFDVSSEQQEAALQCLTEQDIREREEMKEGTISFDEVWASIVFNDSTHSIETGRLTIGERLYLEQLLEDVIFERANRDVA
ncbi:MAG TPA: hypothetical protein DCE42_14700 [Myxococcales bacterium]|nr:hypothetical protein [Myxococcales bacterium]